jgi:hypothetical protein
MPGPKQNHGAGSDPAENVFNTFVDLAGVLRGHERIREIASAPELIVPGRDPLVLERLTRVADGIVEL